MRNLIHLLAVPVMVLIRRGWGVNYATWPRFLVGWVILSMLPTLAAFSLTGSYGEILSEGRNAAVFLNLFLFFSVLLFVVGRVLRAWRPPAGLSNDVGRVWFLPSGTLWQFVPSVALVTVAFFDLSEWHQLRPLTVLGGLYGIIIALDYLLAMNTTRSMQVGNHDAVVLSQGIEMPPAGDNPPRGGEGRTAELVRIYGRSSRR